MTHVDPTADPLARAVTEIAGRLYRLAYSYLKNEQDAMDVVQAVSYTHLPKKMGFTCRGTCPPASDAW